MSEFRNRASPEWSIQRDIIKLMVSRGWIVREMHASDVLFGLPDLFCTHKKFGMRWIEVKLPDMRGSKWTNAQKEWFPKLGANGTPIYVLTAATESEYKKLFGPDNWLEYFMMKG